MSMENRIDPVAMTASVDRQTPRNDFGSILSRKLEDAVTIGGAVVSAAVGRGPVLSAAVSGIRAMAQASSSASPGTVTGALSAGGSPAIGAPGAAGAPMMAGEGGGQDPFNTVLEQQRRESAQYLVMQMNIQAESRSYNTVTNILKVRHESAKAAINNVR